MNSSMLAFEGGQIYIAGGRGPAGPIGPAGSATLPITCGEDILVNRLVYAVGDLIYHADKDTPAKTKVIGLSTQSVSSGGAVEVLTFGKRLDGSFGYPTSGELWLGTNGVLLTTAPSSGTLVLVGTIISSTSIIINIQQGLTLV
mgnify:FL=1